MPSDHKRLDVLILGAGARGRARRGRDFPVSEYLDSRAASPLKRALLKNFVEGFYAARPERLSAQSLAADLADANDDHSIEGKQFRVINGNDALMQWLRDGL